MIETILDNFALEAVLKINLHSETSYAAVKARPDVLSIAQIGNAGASGKVRVRGGAKSAR